MKKLLLLGGITASCSALRPPSISQLTAAQQVAEQQVAARPIGIYDMPSATRKKTKPLVFVDGRKYSTSKVKRLTPNSIESTSIIKPAVGTTIYGRKGRYGVIVITTKKEGK